MGMQNAVAKGKMRPRNANEEEGTSAIALLKGLLFSYLLTGVLLLVLALLLYKMGLSEKIVSICIIGIYVIATFTGGFLTGKKMGNKRFVWGLLLGIAYFLILVVISLCVNHSIGEFSNHFFTTLVLCGAGGMLGGMLS